MKRLPKNFTFYKSVNMEFENIKKTPKTYKELILIPEEFRINLPTSFDIIGNIIIIKIFKGHILRALIVNNYQTVSRAINHCSQ